MTDPDGDLIWSDFLADWGTWFPEVFTTQDELAAVVEQVPVSWIDAMAQADAGAAVATLWEGAQHGLPRFTGYLANETVRIAVGRGDTGCILIYFVRSCRGPVDDGKRYEALAVIDSALSGQQCLTRSPGAGRWDDELIATFDPSTICYPVGWRGIDDFLTDWNGSTYTGCSCRAPQTCDAGHG